MNCARTGVFRASTLLRLENYGKGEVVPALAISGDGAASDGDCPGYQLGNGRLEWRNGVLGDNVF